MGTFFWIPKEEEKYPVEVIERVGSEGRREGGRGGESGGSCHTALTESS